MKIRNNVSLFLKKQFSYLIIMFILMIILTIIIIAALSNSPPTHTTPILNATDFPLNLTNANLTVYNQSTADLNISNTVYNIINWYLNGISLQIVNLPFEVSTSNGTKTQDYSGNNYTVRVVNAINLSTGFDNRGAYNFTNSMSINVTGTPAVKIETNFTVTVWVKRLIDGGYDGYVTKSRDNVGGSYNGWTLGFDDPTNKFSVFVACNGAFDLVLANVALSEPTPSWHFLAFTVRQNSTHNITEFYINGTKQTDFSTQQICSPAFDIVIGKYYSQYDVTHFTNGVIDNVQIFNKTLSQAQIQAIWQNRSDLIVSDDTELGDVWQACITPTDATDDGATKCSNNVTIILTAYPYVTTPQLNSSLYYTNSDINASTTNIDRQASTGTVYFQWFKNNSNVFTHTVSSVANNTNVSRVFSGTNFSRGDIIILQVIGNNGSVNSSGVNSTQITINNSPPTHGTPIFNATDNPNNRTIANLTGYNQSTADSDSDRGDIVENLFNWYVNGTSLQIANLPFEASTSNGTKTQDYSGNNFTVSVINPVFNSTGGFDGRGAYNFTDDQFMNFSNTANIKIETNFTVTAWVKRIANKGYDGFVSKARDNSSGSFNGWNFGFDDPTDKFSIFVACNNAFDLVLADVAKTEGPIPSWEFFAFTVRQNKTHNITEFYINGTKQSDFSTQQICNSPFEIFIGRYYSQFSNHYTNGMIDNIQIFNRTLTQQQIQAIYRNQTNLIVSNDTEINEIWQACIVPTDRIDDGVKKCSNNLTITYIDLDASIDNIIFSNSSPQENQTISITAQINNTGNTAATNALITIYVNGNQTNITISSIGANSNTNKTITGNITIVGRNNVTLQLDTNSLIIEENETNNFITKYVNVSVYQILGLNLSRTLRLATNNAYNMFRPITINSTKYILAYDDNSNINYSQLIAITKKTSGAAADTDFNDIDTLLLLSNASDSIKITYGNNTETPLTTTTIDFGWKFFLNVPTINSTTTLTTNFYTGILWDSSDDIASDGQFDTADKEDLVFISQYTSDQNTEHGVLDSVMKLPATLRGYKNSNQLIELAMID